MQKCSTKFRKSNLATCKKNTPQPNGAHPWNASLFKLLKVNQLWSTILTDQKTKKQKLKTQGKP